MSEELYYPGSTTPLRTSHDALTAHPEPPTGWDSAPIILPYGGVDHEFFAVGALAQALSRSPNTMREWESHGVLPRSRWRSTSEMAKGRRRLYSREQVEGLRDIATEEGLLPPSSRTKVSETHFSARAHELFERLRVQDRP